MFEDNERKRARLCTLLKVSRAVAVPVQDHAPALNALPQFFTSEGIELLVCDHRLFEHGDYAPYFGAQAVAASYQCGIGGIVLTAYERNDADESLRLSRRWIPALLHSSELNADTLRDALVQADSEVRAKQLPRERIPHRTIMTVRGVESRGTNNVVKVLISQWDSSKEVGFPLKLVPTKFRAAVKPGALLIAEVNIEAARQEDLYFDKFELPKPDVLKKAKTLFGRP